MPLTLSASQPSAPSFLSAAQRFTDDGAGENFGKRRNLISGRVQFGLNPNTPGNDDVFVVQAQSGDRCPPHRRFADDLYSIVAPCEMLMPVLSSWIEKSG